MELSTYVLVQWSSHGLLRNFLPKQFFDFHTSKLEHTLIIPATIVSMSLQRDSGLLSVTCDDLVVRLVDIETHRIVREFGGFGGRVLDLVGLLMLDLSFLSHHYGHIGFFV